MRGVGHLTALHEKYFDKGLRILLVSKEPMSTLTSKLGDTPLWLGSDPGGSMLQTFGGGGIPHGYLVDAKGTVVTSLHPANLQEAQIEELLAQVFDPSLGRTMHRSLASAERTYGKGQPGKAWAEAARHTEAEDETLRADAAFLRERAEAWGAHRRSDIEASIEAKAYVRAASDLEAVAKDFAPMEVADWAKETLRTLSADPGVADEIKAWKLYEKARDRELAAGGDAKKRKPAVTQYKAVAKKHPGTRAAEEAQKALQRLGEG
jgi:hypothetical protein